MNVLCARQLPPPEKPLRLAEARRAFNAASDERKRAAEELRRRRGAFLRAAQAFEVANTEACVASVALNKAADAEHAAFAALGHALVAHSRRKRECRLRAAK